MRAIRQGFVVAIALGTVAFTTTAMAGKGGVPGPNQNAPGQVFKSEKSSDPLALSPGQDFKARKNDTTLAPGSALSPGQQFKQDSLGTPGNPIPGSLP